jgi:hypothetical protein
MRFVSTVIGKILKQPIKSNYIITMSLHAGGGVWWYGSGYFSPKFRAFAN